MSSTRSLYRLAASASRQARPLQKQTRSIFSSTAPSRTIRPFALNKLKLPSARSFSVSALKSHGHITPPKAGEELYVTFIDKDGDEYKIAVSACGGSCACSTCHVIVVDEEHYDKMPEPEDDENDMLDLAFGLTETSRLGCQVTMTKELDGLRVKLPSMTRNLQASDFS
ncbi:Adrenodoxin-like protein [Colletotrichum tropicale]|nr:Adrenodoxin-like protein [Colletotrichum tropicale]